MRTLIYQTGLSIDRPHLVSTLQGSFEENRKAIKELFKSRFCNKGDRVYIEKNTIPGGFRIAGLVHYDCFSVYTPDCDFDFSCFEVI